MNRVSRARVYITSVFRAAAASTLMILAACGGGGGGGGGGSIDLSTDECATVGLHPLIVDGTACSTGGSPIVKLNLYFNDGTAGLCSGTVVERRRILTAAHCFLPNQRSAAEDSPVIAAAVEIGGQEKYASTVYVHQLYRFDESLAAFNDVAVLELPGPLNLPTLPIITSRKVAAGQTIAIYGFGADENGELGALKSGEMEIFSVTPNHIGSTFSGQGSNVCSGDSGGPAIQQFTAPSGATITGVVGVTSTGTTADCLSGESLFTNLQEGDVAAFLARIPGLAFQ